MTVLTAEHIEDLIRRSLPDAAISAEDIRGDGAHFAVTVIWSGFDNLSRVAQHRQVYEALAGHVDDGSLHAVQITTRAG